MFGRTHDGWGLTDAEAALKKVGYRIFDHSLRPETITPGGCKISGPAQTHVLWLCTALRLCQCQPSLTCMHAHLLLPMAAQRHSLTVPLQAALCNPVLCRSNMHNLKITDIW